MTHLVQLRSGDERRVALVEEPELCLLPVEVSTVFGLIERAVLQGTALSSVVASLPIAERLSYDAVYAGATAWQLLTPVDCPGAPQRVLVSGTGLTHLGSARERQAMHEGPTPAAVTEMTDSMRMFEWGRTGGKPAAGEIGIAPEWFYKGDGSVLRGPGEALTIPGHAEDGGEEAEIAVIYYVDWEGRPWRVGMCTGNEFSDHIFERRNYLNLAGSKLRECSLGPELVIDPLFDDVSGHVLLTRDGSTLWERSVRSGEANMAHSLGNLEHHHFKFAGHRQPGMLHVHFVGADALSFGEGIRLQEGDTVEIEFTGFGRALRNGIRQEAALKAPLPVRVLR